ncbi:bifunctional phosphoribosylaminoimidazolecarboxamide formyltransferase/IMP cyclohydrolase [Coxiella endosymbiont of Amblyomma nuttalli]|uniref:bifunctional phosphoribosylaminoimidazolecarboxamide formyltransferase/IMP cyclohydrolase n=1 Tax=Coxiella endosymbiont of Amblyomma nuttalli TaxID=2749996 RepID=UPI001BA67263|nr:bifunctional phosphoribosylaminoimidazolecarboxamide formyltransferase/IMP cyclohydrolase [Coxiella endosymbiont of Amblyomma nuttalli]QTS84031.1 Bifunctional purine biosynthesis protein PurH [Coxiella endosymbiont of Amblyomma nuttalli]
MNLADNVNVKLPVKRALISTSDKTGLIEFVSQLVKRGIEIMATSGTAKLLREHQISVIDTAQYTGFPEIMGGRVKTLHPKIYGGLLAWQNVDNEALNQHAIKVIDLLVVNLYPFHKMIAMPYCSIEQAIKQIDVGGHSMLRAGAKNFSAVTVIIDHDDYSLILKEMEMNEGSTLLSTRKRLAQKTFEHLSRYDAQISAYLSENESELFPSQLSLSFQKKTRLRYGENSHQSAALYSIIPPVSSSLTEAELIQGKPLSFNNFLDSDCAYRFVYEGTEMMPTCVIVKHATICGAACAKTQLSAYEKAYATDPLSAFGGVIAFNTLLEKKTTEQILSRQFVEVIIAPSFSNEALVLLKAKPNLRLLIGKSLENTKLSYSFYSISGGLLAQETDITTFDPTMIHDVSQRHPTREELQDLYFAWQVVKYVKSNAIVYAKDKATYGIGSGQTSRVFAAKIAVIKAENAGLSLKNAVMASDAFFSFSDGIKIAAEAGITAVIQPGCSVRDKEIIKAVDQAGMAMIFTYQRHFRH